MDVLISIKPCYVEKICAGIKCYEYRKRIFSKDVERIYVYASSPIQKIVGFFEYSGAVSGTPDYVWSNTHNYSGVNIESYKNYYYGRDVAYALIVKHFYIFSDGINPWEIFDKFFPPQSFMYIRKGHSYEKLRNMVFE